jgi:hypothetical protein
MHGTRASAARWQSYSELAGLAGCSELGSEGSAGFAGRSGDSAGFAGFADCSELGSLDPNGLGWLCPAALGVLGTEGVVVAAWARLSSDSSADEDK